MDLKGLNIGVILTGSFCTFSKVVPQIKKIVSKNANVIPIMSYNAYKLNTKFGEAKEFIKEIESITKNKILHTIQEVEPIGPKKLTDIMVVIPCSGNTIAKIANGITDTPACMAVKSHLRNERPLVIGISTNDGLAASAENIGKLLNRRNCYFIPFKQDNPITKPRSIVFSPEYIIPTIENAMDNEQIQPLLL